MYLKYGSTDQIIKERLIEKEVNLQGLKSLTASQKLHYVIEKFGFKETIKIIYSKGLKEYITETNFENVNILFTGAQPLILSEYNLRPLTAPHNRTCCSSSVI